MKRVSIIGIAALSLAAITVTSCSNRPKLSDNEALVEYTQQPKGTLLFGTFGPDKFNTNQGDTLQVAGTTQKVNYADREGDVYFFLQKGVSGPIFFAPQPGGVVLHETELKGADSVKVTTFTIDADNISDVNKSFNLYNQLQAKFQLAEQDLNKKADAATEMQMDSLRGVYAEMQKSRADAIKDFILNNKNLAGLFAFNLNSDMLREQIGELSPVLKAIPEAGIKAAALEVVAKMEAVAIGQHFIDFALPSVKGDSLRLSDYAGKGKPVLLDFWASWCGPCRMDNPNLVRIYNEYHPKGLEIFAVSLDQSKENWEKGIKDDKLTWPQVSSLAAWGCPVRTMYMVNGIPNNYLLDGNGIIVARGLHGEELEEKLKELLN